MIDHLGKWNKEDIFRGMFDLERIGLMGHSLGGATVFDFACRDQRMRCVILFDASLHLTGDQVPNAPVLNMRRESSWEEDEEIGIAYMEKQKWLYVHLPSTKSFVKIMGASHLSFSTVGHLIGQSQPNVTAAIGEVTVAFLNEFLNGEPGAYLRLMRSSDRPPEAVEIDGLGSLIDN